MPLVYILAIGLRMRFYMPWHLFHNTMATIHRHVHLDMMIRTPTKGSGVYSNLRNQELSLLASSSEVLHGVRSVSMQTLRNDVSLVQFNSGCFRP